MMIKELVKRIVLGKRYSSETFTKYLRSRGVRIGEDVTFFVPSKITVDEIYPWMISIGNHVRITEGCKIISHGPSQRLWGGQCSELPDEWKLVIMCL